MTRARPFQARVPGGLASKGTLQPSGLLKEDGMEKTSEHPIKPGDPPGVVPKSAPHWAPNLKLNPASVT